MALDHAPMRKAPLLSHTLLVSVLGEAREATKTLGPSVRACAGPRGRCLWSPAPRQEGSDTLPRTASVETPAFRSNMGGIVLCQKGLPFWH